jgi:predicted transcriptional regulator
MIDMNMRDRQIIMLLIDQPGMTNEELAEIRGTAVKTVNDMMARMAFRGLVKRKKHKGKRAPFYYRYYPSVKATVAIRSVTW